MSEGRNPTGSSEWKVMRAEEEIFADHVAHPRGCGVLSSPIATVTRSRPVCGDEVTIVVGLSGAPADACPRVEVRGTATGCAVNRASTSLLCEVMEGGLLTECEERAAAFRRMMGGDARAGVTTTDRAVLKDAVVLADIRRFPARFSCVMNAWDAFAECLEQLEQVLRGKEEKR